MKNSTDYGGKAQLTVGNGSKLPITHTGSSYLRSIDGTSPILLNHVLCVPHIAKKFLSVSQLTKDNHASATFYPNHCVV